MPKEPKQRQDDNIPPPPQNNPRQCHFWVKRKRRYCHLPTKLGNKFCGEHLICDQEGKRRRIPCPYDRSHTVYEDELQSHLRKCNARPLPKQPYFSLDINCTLASSDSHTKIALSELPKEELDALIKKIEQWYDLLVPEIQTSVLDHPVLQKKMETLKNTKHAIQQASLLGHMEKLSLLPKDGCFIEFGAGKGELSRFVQAAVADDGSAVFILVDRKNMRLKFDSNIRAASDPSAVRRIWSDIKDLDLSKVDLIENKKVIAFSKHLCGSATDVTLKALVNLAKSTDHG
ncbi:5472_t:CDS:2 [Paraglomus occultum]|uniref:tRNA:m(4)X modification enzyme TRM13 n=1 Tax=Paraglomus occultum TaxID=144539 RepID=A0A9N8WRC9_9GLOM|nr:5472_t:CDS:2 [Paraglomus occultum]